MKNKLILSALIATSSLFSNNGTAQHFVNVYKNVPELVHIDDVMLQLVIISAALCAKYTNYTFEELDYHDGVVFVAYNDECTLYLRWSREKHECEAQFCSKDTSYSYASFKTIIDSYFLYI